ncbi:MAG: flagellar biosynthetic protein FliR [Propionivibrio sp.]
MPVCSTQVRLVLGLALTMAISPALPAMPAIEPASGQGLLILAQQMIIGFAMGFILRLVFSAIDLAGMMISTQMGLGFATAYDPQTAGQTPVVAELIGILALLAFLAIDGHLMTLATLMRSFTLLPVGMWTTSEASWLNIANAGAVIFSSGVMLALPALTALLIANIALGVLGRVAPQLNLIVIGFPVTITVGFVALYVGMSHLGAPLQALFEHGLRSMLGFFVLR